MSKFIKGLELCERFFYSIAEPILKKHFPDLHYSAGILGYGSDVLGFDDEISTDHMWGPRFYLFLSNAAIKCKQNILDVLSNELPYTFEGYSVNFSSSDPSGKSVRIQVYISSGKVSPLIFVYTIEEYILEYLGVNADEEISEIDWLAFSEHRLLALTSGKMFTDDLKLGAKLEKFRFYPENVRFYLVASNWSLIAEEQAFLKRCFYVGDEIGSVLVCCRMAERLMRLSFLYCQQYAPYSKWFGTAFNGLPIQNEIKSAIRNAVTARDIVHRENNMVLAQKLLVDLHNQSALTDYIKVDVKNYYDRDIKVIYAERISEATAQRIQNSVLSACPMIGTLSAVANFTEISDNPKYRENVKSLYYSKISGEIQ